MGTSAVFGFYVVSSVVCWTVILTQNFSTSDDENLRDVVRTLKGQVRALLERRQEDFNVLEESIRHSLDKNSELAFVKTELEEIRRDVLKLKGGKKPTLNEQKNDHLTVRWLSTAVSELRAELAEVSAARNSSAEIQQRQELASGLDLLRGDVASFRRDLEELRAEQQQTVVTLGQLKQDVETSVKNGRSAASASAGAKAQMDEVKGRMSSLAKSLTKLSRDVKRLEVSLPKRRRKASTMAITNELPFNRISGEDKKYRRNRLLRQHIMVFERSSRKLEERQNNLDHAVQRLEEKIKASPGELDESAERRLAARIGRLEEEGKYTKKQLFNVSRRVSELKRLHLSVLELLESVENLESKVDQKVPELQREISKLEFNLAQATSSLSLVKEHQSRDGQIFLPSTTTTATAPTTGRIPTVDDLKTGHPFNESSLPELIESLETVQKEYDNIVRHLPHDCGFVDGKSGIYAIAPGEGPPLLVACDTSSGPGGWTVVQRRIDGSQEFNRKWKEYAVGFGTPSGEFWLGNEALHRLTSENCSSLRIDLADIYGKKWVAKYEIFYVSNAEDGYRIHVRGYSGNASDALEYQNEMQFSAVDSDRDISNTHCAQNYEGGWWFSHCQHANLNGRYNLGLTWFDGTRNEWIAVAFSEMKIGRRKNCGT